MKFSLHLYIMYLYITKYSRVPFLKNPVVFFLIRFKTKQKLKMFMGKKWFMKIILFSGFLEEKVPS